MKLKGLFAIMAAALMLSMSFTSCEELEGLIDDEKESTDNQAFFPNTYRQRTVAAWYSLTEKEESGTRIEAVFLFDDNSFVTTKSRTYTDGRSQERKILAEGEYTLTEGDYDNGKAEVKINGVPDPMTVEIKDGKMLAMGETFTKQNNKKVPKPSEEAEGGDNNQGGGDNNQGGGDNNQGNGLEAFFPTAYSGKTVSAWYTSAGEITEQGYEMKYLAAIYFFADNTCVGTTNMIAKGPNGEEYDRIIGMEGGYRILEGDFNTGKIQLTYGEGKSMTVQIENGQIKIADVETGSEQYTIYIKQDNSNVPKPSDPTDNGQGGGDDNQGGENQNPSGVPAFFPKAYADKTVVAWYSYEESISVQTMVQAVFLFSDNTLIVTEHKVFAKEVQENDERYILATGTYTLEGNYDNGSATVILVPERKVSAYINNGKLNIEISKFTFIKRDVKDVPQPLDPTDQGQQGGDDNQGGDGGPSGLAAWYSGRITENGNQYTVDVILLDDYTVAFAQTRVDDGSGYMYMTEIVGVGTYKIVNGDLTNGTVQIVMYGEPKEFTVSNGAITISNEGQSITYYKQDNANYHGPTDFSDYVDDEGGNEGGNEGGEGDDVVEFDQSLMKAYLPSDFSSEAIAAWYMYYGEDNNSCRIESVFLFNDNTLVVTKTKIYSKADGRAPEYKVTAKGQYRLTEGSDYENGTASVVTADGMTMEVVIEEGVMTAMETEFYLMPNDLLSSLTTSGK